MEELLFSTLRGSRCFVFPEGAQGFSPAKIQQ
jgi:hypothetical protein